MNQIKLQQVMGLPPEGWIDAPAIYQSMPILSISPCKANFESGIELFSLRSEWDEYTKLLSNHGYVPSTSQYLQYAFIADSFPTDTFRNEYGETFIDKMGDVVSSGFGDLAQMFGASTGSQLAHNLTDKDFAGKLSGIGKSIVGGAGNIISGVHDAANGIMPENIKKFFNNGMKTINSMVAGARVDFPMVWKNSGFEPSYTATIRLYNPNPGSLKSTQHYIIGPLASLLLLGLPRSADGSTYNWPFLHQISSPGIYDLSAAFISNITVIKGGDQQQIGMNQRLSVVDVRIDFGSLYGSILVDDGKLRSSNRPTLKSYLKALESEKYVSRDDFYNPANMAFEMEDYIEDGVPKQRMKETIIAKGKQIKGTINSIPTNENDIAQLENAARHSVYNRASIPKNMPTSDDPTIVDQITHSVATANEVIKDTEEFLKEPYGMVVGNIKKVYTFKDSSKKEIVETQIPV